MLPRRVRLWGPNLLTGLGLSCCCLYVALCFRVGGGGVRGVAAAVARLQNAGKVLTHAETVLPSCYVRRELIPVLAVIATHVAFKRVTEPVTAHVDGVHDMI